MRAFRSRYPDMRRGGDREEGRILERLGRIEPRLSAAIAGSLLPVRLVRGEDGVLQANGRRSRLIARARGLLHTPSPAQPDEQSTRESWQDLFRRLTGRDPTRCPFCDKGTLRTIALRPGRLPARTMTQLPTRSRSLPPVERGSPASDCTPPLCRTPPSPSPCLGGVDDILRAFITCTLAAPDPRPPRKPPSAANSHIRGNRGLAQHVVSAGASPPSGATTQLECAYGNNPICYPDPLNDRDLAAIRRTFRARWQPKGYLRERRGPCRMGGCLRVHAYVRQRALRDRRR